MGVMVPLAPSPRSPPRIQFAKMHGQRGVSDPSVAAGKIADAAKSGGRSRHVLAFERVAPIGASAGGKDRRPVAALGISRRLLHL